MLDELILFYYQLYRCICYHQITLDHEELSNLVKQLNVNVKYLREKQALLGHCSVGGTLKFI